MVYAQVDASNPATNPIAKFATIASITDIIIPIIMTAGAVSVLIMLFYAAFLIITAGGEPEKVQQAKRVFTFSVLGIIIMVLAYLIIRVLGVVLNIRTELQMFGFFPTTN